MSPLFRNPSNRCIARRATTTEQIGWDGKPRPKELRKPRKLTDWPEVIDADPNAYAGEPFWGPWG